MKTAADYPDGVEFAHVVKFYGTNERMFLFPYTGKLTERKITLMAADLMQHYPNESLSACENVVRNLSERCGWVRIEPAQDMDGWTMNHVRGDGWMNIRPSDRIIVHETCVGLVS